MKLFDRIVKYIPHNFYKLPIPSKLYWREIQFFDEIKLEELDKLDQESLGAEMRMIAHVLDKVTYFPNDKQLFSSYKPELQRILKIWDEKYPTNEFTYLWVKDIFDKYEQKFENPDESFKIDQELKELKNASVLELIKARRSIRRWKNLEISNKIIENLVDAARWAPCSSDKQTCKFLIIRDKKSIEFLGKRFAGGVGFAHTATVHILVLVDMRRYRLPFERHMAYLDGAAAIENILLMAHSLGLGACWLNWSISESNEKKVYKLFNIPRYMLPISVIALGYPDIMPEPPARKDITDFMVYERF